MKIIISIILISLSLQTHLRFTRETTLENYKQFENLDLLVKAINTIAENKVSLGANLEEKVKNVLSRFKVVLNRGNNHQYIHQFWHGLKQQYYLEVIKRLLRGSSSPEEYYNHFFETFQPVLNTTSNTWSLVNVCFCFNGMNLASFMFLINVRDSHKIDMSMITMYELKYSQPFDALITEYSISTDGGLFNSEGVKIPVKTESIRQDIFKDIMHTYKIYFYIHLCELAGIKL